MRRFKLILFAALLALCLWNPAHAAETLFFQAEAPKPGDHLVIDGVVIRHGHYVEVSPGSGVFMAWIHDAKESDTLKQSRQYLADSYDAMPEETLRKICTVVDGEVTKTVEVYELTKTAPARETWVKPMVSSSTESANLKPVEVKK